MKGRIIILLAVLSVVLAYPLASWWEDQPTDLMALIEETSRMAPNHKPGRFVLDIKASGYAGDWFYLNTHDDYRDRLNVSVAISPQFQRSLEHLYGDDLQAAFEQKRIAVTGHAFEKRIRIRCGGRRTSMYYFQTHIEPQSWNGIEVLTALSAPSGQGTSADGGQGMAGTDRGADNGHYTHSSMATTLALVFVVFVVLFWLASLIHCITNPTLDNGLRVIGVVLIVFLGPLGSLIYLGFRDGVTRPEPPSSWETKRRRND